MIDLRRVSCYGVRAMIRIAISLLVATSVIVVPLRVSAGPCIPSNATGSAACKSGCCVKKECCAEPAKNSAPLQPLAKSESSSRLPVACFVAIALALPNQMPAPEYDSLQAPVSPARSSSRLALLCTFLI